MNRKIAIIGDFHNSKTQSTIADSIEHSNKKLGVKTSYQWFDTTSLDRDNYAELLSSFSGIWSAPGSPFKSLNGALNAITYARENKIPHLGTCGGYQHSIIEYAKNVLGFQNAKHAEYTDELTDLVIDRMSCSLVGTRGKVSILPNSVAYKIYQNDEIDVDYYCSYGLSPEYTSLVLNGDFICSGIDVNKAVRMIELKNHPFYMLTAFVPQVDSTFEKPNPLITEFIRRVNSM
jgi:CTP synthase (UTP-ammonia lyase)